MLKRMNAALFAVIALALSAGAIIASSDFPSSAQERSSDVEVTSFKRGADITKDVASDTIKVASGIKNSMDLLYEFETKSSASVAGKGENDTAVSSSTLSSIWLKSTAKSRADSKRLVLDTYMQRLLIILEQDGSKYSIFAADADHGNAGSMTRDGKTISPTDYPSMPNAATIKDNFGKLAAGGFLGERNQLEQPSLGAAFDSTSVGQMPQYVVNPLPALSMLFAGYADLEFKGVDSSTSLKAPISIDFDGGSMVDYELSLTLEKVFATTEETEADVKSDAESKESEADDKIGTLWLSVTATPARKDITLKQGSSSLVIVPPVLSGVIEIDRKLGVVTYLKLTGDYTSTGNADVVANGQVEFTAQLRNE